MADGLLVVRWEISAAMRSAYLLPTIVIIGILAAIGVPAYQNYVKKAKAIQLQQAQPQFSEPTQ